MTYEELGERIQQMTPPQRSCPAVVFMGNTGEVAEVDSVYLLSDHDEMRYPEQLVIGYDSRNDPKLGPLVEKHIVRLDGDFLYQGENAEEAKRFYESAVEKVRNETSDHHVTWSRNSNPHRRFDVGDGKEVEVFYRRKESA